MRFRPLFFAAIAAAATLGAGSASHAGKEVKLVILKEHGVGSSAQAQPFVRDELPAAEALDVFAEQPYKREIIERE